VPQPARSDRRHDFGDGAPPRSARFGAASAHAMIAGSRARGRSRSPTDRHRRRKRSDDRGERPPPETESRRTQAEAPRAIEMRRAVRRRLRTSPLTSGRVCMKRSAIGMTIWFDTHGRDRNRATITMDVAEENPPRTRASEVRAPSAKGQCRHRDRGWPSGRDLLADHGNRYDEEAHQEEVKGNNQEAGSSWWR
jgi:hypothetical protein